MDLRFFRLAKEFLGSPIPCVSLEMRFFFSTVFYSFNFSLTLSYLVAAAELQRQQYNVFHCSRR